MGGEENRGIEGKRKVRERERKRNEERKKHNLETFSPLSFYVSFLYL